MNQQRKTPVSEAQRAETPHAHTHTHSHAHTHSHTHTHTHAAPQAPQPELVPNVLEDDSVLAGVDAALETSDKSTATATKERPRNLDVKVLKEGDTFEREVVRIDGEKVGVRSTKEAIDAERIFKKIRDEYGIRIHSASGVKTLRDRFNKVPKKVLDKLKTTEWEYSEIAGMEKALDRFAPILGSRRENSPERKKRQGVDTIGKVNQTLTKNSRSGKLDPSPMGENFWGARHINMYDSAKDGWTYFESVGKLSESIMIHELAHGLFRHEVRGFVKAMPKWRNTFTKNKHGEESPSQYGGTNALEDFAETMTFYMLDPKTLEKKSPEHFAYMKKLVEKWQD